MKPERIFIGDGKDGLSYADLLGFANGAKSVRRVIADENPLSFFPEFVLSLACGADVALPDAANIGDFPQADLPVQKPRFDSLEALANAVRNSRSKIDLFTSGTTGKPRKISHTVQSLSRSVRVSDAHSDDVWGFAYHPSHIAGLQVFFQAFFNGNEIVNLFGRQKREIFGLIVRRKISHISATPTFYRLLLPEPNVYGSVRRLTLGGEKSTGGLLEKLGAVFPNAKINNIYAATEFGTLLVSDGEYFSIPQSAAELVRIDSGVLCVHKSLLGGGEVPVDGQWYKTRDMVEFAPDGLRFKFAARQSDFINVGGYKVNPSRVEDVLRGFGGVVDVRVYGRKNSVLGNILCADLKTEDGAGADIAKIRKFLSESLEQYEIPRKIAFVSEIESTRTGKIKR